MSSVDWVTLLRDPGAIAARCTEERELSSLAQTALASTVLGAAVLGGVLGSFRGGAQIPLAALKLPLVLLVTLAVCAPAFHALANTLGVRWSFRTVVALALAATARAALVLAALAPPLWLAMDFGLGYHGSVLAAVMVVALGGLVGASLVVRALGASASGIASGLACACVFLAVLAQASWIGRPYLLRPRTEELVFLRGAEGTFYQSIGTSSRSARGLYEAPEAALPTPEGQR